MSHNHYLGCRACGMTTEQDSESAGTNHAASCYRRFAQLNSDVLVELALATRAMVQEGVDFGRTGDIWARFVSEHAGCNAFYELCGSVGSGWDQVGCNCPRRILVKDAPRPACSLCYGRRLVVCPGCTDLPDTDQSSLDALTRHKAEIFTQLNVAQVAVSAGDMGSARAAIQKALRQMEIEP